MTDNSDTTTGDADPLDAALCVDAYCDQHGIDLFGEEAANNTASVYQRLGALADWGDSEVDQFPGTRLLRAEREREREREEQLLGDEEFDSRADELWDGEGVTFEEWASDIPDDDPLFSAPTVSIGETVDAVVYDAEQLDEHPEGQAQLVLREDGVTIVIQGDAEKVEQRFYDHLDETLGTDGDEIEEYPHPEFGEGLVPTEELSDEG